MEMQKIEKGETYATLFKAILSLKDENECETFLRDLCTVQELHAMQQRLEVAYLLREGYVYNEILEKTGASSATISRVNRSLQYGAGGYEKVLSDIYPQEKSVEA